MNITKILLIIIGVVVVGLLIWYFVAKKNSPIYQTSSSPSPTTTVLTSPNAVTSSQPSASASSGNETIQNVTIKSMAFNPSSITIGKALKVKWTNSDTTTHTVTSDNGTFNSPQLKPGDTFEFTFPDAGTFSYHCSIHPTMTAKVIVQ